MGTLSFVFNDFSSLRMVLKVQTMGSREWYLTGRLLGLEGWGGDLSGE